MAQWLARPLQELAETTSLGDYLRASIHCYASQSSRLPNRHSDEDKSPDGDAGENTTGTVVDNEIRVTLQPGEAEDGNNFVDSTTKGTISGNVTDPNNVPLPGAMITLKDSGDNVVATTMTGSDGTFEFPHVQRGYRPPNHRVYCKKGPVSR
jgi:hypothetical protein